jgi:DNA ligase-1
MAKALDAPYEAGRRGASWLKVKRAHTLDLVVLAAEWGNGRRKGWLSNLHLGAAIRRQLLADRLGDARQGPYKGMPTRCSSATKELLARALRRGGPHRVGRPEPRRDRLPTTCGKPAVPQRWRCASPG